MRINWAVGAFLGVCWYYVQSFVMADMFDVVQLLTNPFVLSVSFKDGASSLGELGEGREGSTLCVRERSS